MLSQTPALHLGVHKHGKFTELCKWQVIGAGAAAGGASADTGAGVPLDLTAERRKMAAQIMRLTCMLEDVQELVISRGWQRAEGLGKIGALCSPYTCSVASF
jgi:hypothetical protein